MASISTGNTPTKIYVSGFTSIITACLMLVVLTTCGKDSPTKPQPPDPPTPPTPPPVQLVPTSIVITPTAPTLTSIGQTVRLTAVVRDQNGQPMPGANVTWSSGNGSVATVTAQGLVTAVGNGSTQITARSATATASITVTVAQSATSITIAPESATLMSIGATVQLAATVLDQNDQPVTGAAVSWESSDESVATVSAQGLVTAAMNGTATITAMAGDATQSIQIAVVQSAVRIVIEPAEATLMSIGATVQLAATVFDQNDQPVTGAAVSWESSDESVATVSAQGLVTAAMNGTATITAMAGDATQSIQIAVVQSAVRIVIEPAEATLMSIGESVLLSATVLDQNDRPVSGAVVTWESSDESVATVSAQGLVTAVQNGTAKITAMAGDVTRSVQVTVVQSAVRIVIEPAEATLMSIGESVQLSATVLDQNDRPVSGAVVTWESSDESVATVSAEGLVTAAMNGTATITAKAGDATQSIQVAVSQSAVRIVIEPAEATLTSIGATVQLAATVLDQNDQPVSGAVVTWESSDESVATVSAQGLVTAAGNGAAVITARAESISNTIPITVEDTSQDRDALISLYHATNGPNWTNSTNWLSEEQLAEWHGVRTDNQGRVFVLALSDNSLTGSIPVELGDLSNLVILNLSNNSLSGPIPEELGILSNLQRLYLSRNQLTGSIPAELGSLRNLIQLYLDSNELTGPIPSELGSLSNLEDLHLYSNGLTGSIPVELGSLGNLIQLWLNSNGLTGAIPAELGSLSNLESLILRENRISGSIPAELGGLSNLVSLDLKENRISGSIPAELGGLSNLRVLFLRGNELTGCIPNALQDLFNNDLDQLGLPFCNEPGGSAAMERESLVALYNVTDGPNWTNSTNWLSDEPLGTWYGVDTDDQGNIFALDLSNNSLSGTIPSELGSLSQLDSLNLVNNQLSGEIPVELGRLSNLKALALNNNQLSGEIPVELGRLSNLWGLGLGNNQLSGEIPVELGNLSNLAALGLNNNQLSGEIPVELGRLSQLQALALNNNQLSGEIPVELGRLSNLVALLLDNNQLSGEIPVELGGLSNLVFLSFSGNELTGCIPEELRSVPFQDFDDLGLPYCDESGAEPSALNSN